MGLEPTYRRLRVYPRARRAPVYLVGGLRGSRTPYGWIKSPLLLQASYTFAILKIELVPGFAYEASLRVLVKLL